MNATERARRSDALYRDDAKMHRRDLCDMVAQREAEIAGLREQLQDAEHEESIAWDRARNAERQNAKLRELAAGIGHLLFVLDVDYCAICPMDDINHPCPVHTVNGGECLYEAGLRELGVEVDG